MSDFPSIQDVFCGEQTVVHFRRGREAPSPAAMIDALTILEIECEGVRRDDSATL